MFTSFTKGPQSSFLSCAFPINRIILCDSCLQHVPKLFHITKRSVRVSTVVVNARNWIFTLFCMKSKQTIVNCTELRKEFVSHITQNIWKFRGILEKTVQQLRPKYDSMEKTNKILALVNDFIQYHFWGRAAIQEMIYKNIAVHMQ